MITLIPSEGELFLQGAQDDGAMCGTPACAQAKC